jgi:hypothetical protein
MKNGPGLCVDDTLTRPESNDCRSGDNDRHDRKNAANAAQPLNHSISPPMSFLQTGDSSIARFASAAAGASF